MTPDPHTLANRLTSCAPGRLARVLEDCTPAELATLATVLQRYDLADQIRRLEDPNRALWDRSLYAPQETGRPCTPAEVREIEQDMTRNNEW